MRGQDRFYTFTALLAAHGHQRATMRIVAGCILSLGIPAVLAAAAPRATFVPGGRGILVGAGLTCAGLAAPWLRQRWPTRRESAAVVVIGALTIAAGAGIATDPLSGLLVAVAFVLVLGFTALFHSTGLLTAIITIATLTIGWLAVRVAATDVAAAIAVTAPLVIVNLIVTFACRTIAAVGGYGTSQLDVEPLTGLPTRAEFYELFAVLLGARHREDDRFLILAVVGIDNVAAVRSLAGAGGGIRMRVIVGQALRETVRRDAVVSHVSEAEFLIADIFPTSDPAPLIDRILGAVAATPTGATASIGVVNAPLPSLTELPPNDILDEIIALAATGMHEARQAGGNQARYLSRPSFGFDTRRPTD